MMPWRFWIAAVLIASHVGLTAYMHREETLPDVPVLANVPETIGRWHLAQEDPLSPETLENLQPDSYLNRTYRSQNSMANMMIAYFRTQRDGRVPHSPKNCLPSAGWLPVWRREVQVTLPGGLSPMASNQFLIANGGRQMMVYYLYLTSRRAVASDYAARVFLALDALRYTRTDTMLVRMIVPVQGDERRADRDLADFGGHALAALRQIYHQ